MGNWFKPMTVFIAGQLLILIATIFMPGLDTATTALDSETSSISGFVWGWDWLMTNGVVRFLFYLFCEAAILYLTAKVFLSSRI